MSVDTSLTEGEELAWQEATARFSALCSAKLPLLTEHQPEERHVALDPTPLLRLHVCVCQRGNKGSGFGTGTDWSGETNRCGLEHAVLAG